MHRRRVFGLLLVVACLAAMGWTLASLGPRKIASVAVNANPWWLLASFVPLVGRYLIWGVKWHRILARRQSLPFPAALRILMAGSFVNLTTPTAKLAGGVLRAVLLRRLLGWKLPGAYGRAFADQATGVLGTVALFGFLAVGAGIGFPELPARATLLAGGSLILLGLGVGIALRGWAWRQLGHPRWGRLLARLAPARFRDSDGDGESGDNPVTEVFFPLLGEGRTLETMLPDILWASVSFFSLCVSGAMVVRSLGVDTNLWMIAVVIVLGYFAGVLVGVWGGVGVTEAALIGLYVQIGIPATTAAAAALLHRAAFYAVVLVWGGVALMRQGRTHSPNSASTPV